MSQYAIECNLVKVLSVTCFDLRHLAERRERTSVRECARGRVRSEVRNVKFAKVRVRTREEKSDERDFDVDYPNSKNFQRTS